MSYFKLENLKKTYNSNTPHEVKAVDDISLKLNKGDFLTIVGSNAAGKSTIFGMIGGSIIPDSGKIILENKDLLATSEHDRASFIARVKQDPNHSLVSGMSVVENFALSKLRGERKKLKKGVTEEIEKECISKLKILNLGIEKRTHNDVSLFSGGQRQAIALISAIEKAPELLLLDEHTAALDPKMAHKILELTNNLVSDKKITTLMITHNITHALHYGNRLIVLESGKIKFDISGEEKKKATIAEIIALIEKPVDLEEEFTS